MRGRCECYGWGLWVVSKGDKSDDMLSDERRAEDDASQGLDGSSVKFRELPPCPNPIQELTLANLNKIFKDP